MPDRALQTQHCRGKENTALSNFLGSLQATEQTQEMLLPEISSLDLCELSALILRAQICSLYFTFSGEKLSVLTNRVMQEYSSPFPITRSSMTGNLTKRKSLQGTEAKIPKTN